MGSLLSMEFKMRNKIISLIVALGLTFGFANTANAQWGYGYGYGWGGVAAGLAVGALAGAAIASNARPYYGYPDYYVAVPRPRYYYPAPTYYYPQTYYYGW